MVEIVGLVIWTVLVAGVAMWWGKRHPSAEAFVARNVQAGIDIAKKQTGG